MNHKVLLVDDDPNILNSLRRAFHSEPFDVLVATSAEEALLVMHRQSVDVVISDQEMPGMGGAEFLNKVHKEFPKTVRFTLSGKVNAELAIQAINRGDRFFNKPSNADEIAYALRQVLQQKDLLSEAKNLLQVVKKQYKLIKRLSGEKPDVITINLDDAEQKRESDPSHELDTFINELRDATRQSTELIQRLS